MESSSELCVRLDVYEQGFKSFQKKKAQISPQQAPVLSYII